MSRFGLASLGLLALALLPRPATAASLALADSFRIGSAGVLCTAQSRVADPALTTMFDRGYRIVCRDAATPVGRLLVLRGGAGRLAAFTGARADGIACPAPAPADLPGLPAAQLAACRQDGLGYSVYTLLKGRDAYVAEGYAGYGSALRLGLAALAADAPVKGEVEVAVTEAGDPAAFARVQAGSLDPGQALAEGYVRNNAGSFAEASEFFDLLIERSRQGAPGFNRSAEYLAGQALQQSNLGNFAEAEALLARARAALDPGDIVVTRLVRNFTAMHALNRRQPEAARTALATAATADLSGLDAGRVGQGYIDVPLAQKLSADDDALKGLAGASTRLTPVERAQLLDAQAKYLEGAAARMKGRDSEARAALAAAEAQLRAVRGGRVTSLGWLRAGIATERAALDERAGNAAAARQGLGEAAAIYAADYPGSASGLLAQARLAALLARQGDNAGARTIYREVIAASPTTPGAGQVLRGAIAPYFTLLAGEGDAAAADFFAASQILVRPGVAQTQAVLARELSGGSDAAAGQFRQSVTLSRDLVRLDAEIARLTGNPAPAPGDAAALASLRERRETLAGQQTALLAELSANPRYRSVTTSVVTLAELQRALRPGEAYYKLLLVGGDAYALFAGPAMARVLKVDASASDLGALVRALRDSIVRFDEFGRPRTDPFDAVAARRLTRALFDPVADALGSVSHLVFEPDGPLLQLPANLLLQSDRGIADYQRHVEADDDKAYDLTGLDWLGRDRMVSTTVSPRAFLDVRAIAPSRATRHYLGLGENALPPGLAPTSLPATARRTRGAAPAPPATPLPSRDPCDWPLAEWGRPIAADELRIGAALLGKGSAEIVTGAAFTDTGIAARQDLAAFRVIHFATHGLVTAPRPECPARPALLTSFGAAGSDGLLSFREIFDLKLDADTIILSACDTAGTATAAATREAGVATGGNFALDGLVRAFVGAGARAVVASHWPVPDDYGATRTLISGLFAENGQLPVGEALRRSQVKLMDAADTSHPYYWAGFAIVGDAAKPLASAPDGP